MTPWTDQHGRKVYMPPAMWAAIQREGAHRGIVRCRLLIATAPIDQVESLIAQGAGWVEEHGEPPVALVRDELRRSAAVYRGRQPAMVEACRDAWRALPEDAA
ncbi:MAG TPA: hypothetical protein VF695_17160 [Sphingomonas sp.]|jgi:hypothetical protein